MVIVRVMMVKVMMKMVVMWALDAEPHNLSLFPETHIVMGEPIPGSFSDFHVYTMACISTHAHTRQINKCNVLSKLRVA